MFYKSNSYLQPLHPSSCSSLNHHLLLLLSLLFLYLFPQQLLYFATNLLALTSTLPTLCVYTMGNCVKRSSSKILNYISLMWAKLKGGTERKNEKKCLSSCLSCKGEETCHCGFHFINRWKLKLEKIPRQVTPPDHEIYIIINTVTLFIKWWRSEFNTCKAFCEARKNFEDAWLSQLNFANSN